MKSQRRNIQSWIALLIAMGFALYLCWLMVEPFVGVILWAAVLAIVAFPVNERLRKRRWGRSSAAGITSVIVVLVLLIPIAIVGFALARQAGPAVDAVQDGVRRVLDPSTTIGARIAQYVDVGQVRDPQFIAERVRTMGGTVAQRTLGIIGGALGAIVGLFLTLFTLYFLLRDGDRILPKMRALLPLEEHQADEVFKRTHDVIMASIFGIIVIAAVQGFLAGIALWALGIHASLLWGVVTFFASMIPIAGSTVVLMPATIYLFASGHWIKAVILLAWGTGVVGMADNVLRPRLVGDRTRLHELVVLFSALGGIQVFGVLGLIIGPVVAAVTMSLLDVLRRADLEPAVKVEVVKPESAKPESVKPESVQPE